MAALMASVAWFVFFNFYAMPNEERILEAHFGDVYREYKKKVPRWFGKMQS
jgi:protein-S-isoprenylcysteine O-methyltransferase Ste14